MPDQSSAATEHAIIQEITAPLETLPDDPLSVIDADFPHALRGYDRVAVDEYVRQTRQLVAELQATRSPEAAVRRALQRVGDQISGVLQRAHETAEQITAQSRSEAEDRLQHARIEASAIAEAAERRVKDLDADTDRIWLERQRIVADAEDLAGQLLALAKVAAERFPTDEETDEELIPDDDAALVAGTPVEAGAAAEPAPEPLDEDEPELLEEDEPELLDEEPEPEPEPGFEDEDVTRTRAFTPLQQSGEETTILPGPAEETTILPQTGEETVAAPEADEPTAPTAEAPARPPDEPRPPRAGSTDDDATGVIRPASQAANRRRGR